MRAASFLVVAILAGCGGTDDPPGEPVRVAMLAPATGPLQGVGESFLRVARAAVKSINDLGGIDGRELVLIEEDTMANPDLARETLAALIDDGIVAAVGPATSGEVAEAYATAEMGEVPIISPSSTAPFLSDVTDDNGYMFRNVPDDDVQGLAIGYYLHTLSGVTSAAVIYEDTDYGRGLKDAFADAFVALGGTVTDEVAFGQGLPDAAAAEAAIADLAAGDPTMVVMVALEQDAIALSVAWDNGGDPVVPGMQFFFTDGARSQNFLDGAPDAVAGMCGSAPTYPVRGDAYDVLKDAYEEDNDDVLEAQVYAPNVWDAFHLIAAGLVQQVRQDPDAPVGGAGLRDAITEISKAGQILHAGEWRNIISNLRAGNDVDYDGAAGPNNFDDSGQAVGPYEVWCVGPDRASFTQQLFLGTQALEELQGN
jgi:ABC-type branched-subunit amino acid transport system substrate-binding protein